MPGTCQGLRVLVVDDSRDNADSLAMLLRHAGADVLAVYDGQAAIQSARGFQPHVVFLDLALPKLDGFAIAKELRSSPGMEAADIIAVTGLAPAITDRRKEGCGIDLILEKPVDPNLLRSLLIEAAAKHLKSACSRTMDEERLDGWPAEEEELVARLRQIQAELEAAHDESEAT